MAAYRRTCSATAHVCVPVAWLRLFVALQSLAGHQSGVECVAFDATEEAVVAGAAGGTLKMFDIAAAKGARAAMPLLCCATRLVR